MQRAILTCWLPRSSATTLQYKLFNTQGIGVVEAKW